MAIALLAASPILAASLTLSGCGGGPSNVSQGLRYTSEDPAYDRYFDTLYDAQVALEQAPQQEAQLRQELAGAIKTGDTQMEPLIAAVEKQTLRMKEAGLTVALTISEPGAEPNAKIDFTSGLPEDADRQISTAIEDAARGALELTARMDKAKSTINELEINTGPLLAAVDETFRKAGPIRKAEVRSNLEDAQRLFPLMRERATQTAASARSLVDGLVKVANTTPPPAAEPPPQPETAPPPKKKGARRAPPKSTGAAPTPKPTKPPATASDGFEP